MVTFVEEVVVEVVAGLGGGSFSFAGWSEEKRNSWCQIKLLKNKTFILGVVGSEAVQGRGHLTTPKPSSTPIDPYLHEGIPVSCV